MFSRARGVLVLVVLAACGGSAAVHTSSSGTGGAGGGLAGSGTGNADAGTGGATSTSMSTSSTSSTPPPDCVLALATIDWVGDAGADCLGSPPSFPWAAGLGGNWQTVFGNQCRTAESTPACATQASAYFQCLRTSGGTCAPCATPGSGQCQGSGGVVSSPACSAAEVTLAECLCKPAGAPCTSDLDCCAPSHWALTCLSSSCTY
jgi:hypothetical protein